MASKISSLFALAQTHQKEIKDFHAAAFEMWQPVSKKIEMLQQDYGTFEHAPVAVQKEIVRLQTDYTAEWGTEGTVIKDILKRQKEERQTVLAAARKLNDLTKDEKDFER